MRFVTKLYFGTILLTGFLLAENLPLGWAGSIAISTSTKTTVAETGIASYYADKYHGRTTASGEVFDTGKLTAAHRTLAFGTIVRVTHLASQRSVTVRINDRGPFVKDRVIDLSRAAARELQIEDAGLAKVKVETLSGVTTGSRP